MWKYEKKLEYPINIKTKDLKPKSVKVLDKATAWTERVKDPIVYANEKSKDAVSGDGNIVDYGSDKIKYVSNNEYNLYQYYIT